jgi:hypothetical protein
MHPDFIEDLDKSQDAALAVAKLLTRLGKNVLLPRFDLHAKTYEERRAYGDEGDLFIAAPLPFEPQVDAPMERLFQLRRIEVKGKGRDFTGAHDFPYRDHIIVCKCNVLDRADPPIERIIYVNPSRTCFAILDPRNRDGWTKEYIKDSRYPGEPAQLAYITNADQLTFRDQIALRDLIDQEATR